MVGSMQGWVKKVLGRKRSCQYKMLHIFIDIEMV